MAKPQKILTTLLWGCAVLAMLAFVGLTAWKSSEQKALAADGGGFSVSAPSEHLPVLFDAPTFTLTDQNGKPFSSDQLKGHVYAMSLFFTECKGVCPMITGQMQHLLKSMADPRVKIVSISVDPVHDTPAALRPYAERVGAENGRWTLLTGTVDECYGAAHGYKLAVTNPSDHSPNILLVDEKGQVRGIYNAREPEAMADLPADAQELAARAYGAGK